MDIIIKEFIKGAQEAQGVTVIVDVFRAFSTACYAFDNGIKRLIDVATPAEAFALKDKLKADQLLQVNRTKRYRKDLTLATALPR